MKYLSALLLAFSLIFTLPSEGYYEWDCGFCPYHLLHHSEECSSWTNEGELENNTDYFLYPASYIDVNLVREVEPYLHLFPKMEFSFEGLGWEAIFRQFCAHGSCSKCNSPLRYSLVLDDCGDLEMGVKCNCYNRFLNDWDDEELIDENLETKWHLCKEDCIFSGYFDPHFATEFPRLKRHLRYCKRNPECQCYWPKVSDDLDALLDDIYDDFCESLLRYNYEWYPKDEDLLVYERQKLIRHPRRQFDQQLQFVFSYNNLVEALDKFDYKIFSEVFYFSEINEADYSEWKERILNSAKKDFLQLYRTCYKEHPHPNIAKRIEKIS